MSYSNHISDREADQQGQEFFHSEPCMFYGSLAPLPQPNVHALVPAPGNGNIYLHHVSDHQEGALTYGLTQYNGVQHQLPATNIDLTISAPSNHYNPYMAAPSASRDFPVPVNHGPHDRLQSSSHNILGINSDNYRGSNHYMDDVRGLFKRKSAEGIPGNFQYHHALAGSSSSVAPAIARAHESDVLMDASSFTPADYAGNSLLFNEDGATRSMRNRSEASGPDTVSGRNHNHLLQGNYAVQAHQLPGNPWLDLQFNRNGSETQPWAWNQAAPLPFVPGGIGGCVDAGNMGVRGYQITSSNGMTSFPHPPVPQGHPSLHHLPPNVQGMRGHSITFPPQMTAPPQRHLPNSSSNLTPSLMQGIVEAGPRYVPTLPTGFGFYRPHRRDIVLERNTRYRNLPHMRVLPEDGVAMVDVPDYHEVNHPIDQHRDMRLDIDHMSYEELLALGEQIGNVTTGLSDEVIISRLKTRSFWSSGIPSTLESAACLDQETDFCVICQTDYNNQEKIGTLDCGHEYHAECIKKWLVVKNTCPICKSTGLS